MHSFQLQGREAFERRAAILALEAEIAGHGVVLAALRLHRLLAKANFNSNQAARSGWKRHRERALDGLRRLGWELHE
jgi:hypothetical protein